MGFKGLSFTDALNMKGVTDYYPAGEADVRALLAFNVLLCCKLSDSITCDLIYNKMTA